MQNDLDPKGLLAGQKAAMESNGCGVTYEGLRHFCDHPYIPDRQKTCACKIDAEAAIRAYLSAVPDGEGVTDEMVERFAAELWKLDDAYARSIPHSKIRIALAAALFTNPTGGE